MLKLIAIIIVALALLRVWQIYSRTKTERESRERDIALRMKKLEDRKSQNDESPDD